MTDSGPGHALSGFRRLADALRNDNYRAYTIGNAISLIGTWLQRIAVGWLAWQLTKSGTWLGLVAFADLFPTVVLSPFAGAVADRHDRLRILFITQAAAMAQATLLAILTFIDAMTIERLLTLTLALGIANAINQPARLALIPSLVEASHIPSAVALNSIVFNCARFLGPTAAGFAIAHGGIAFAFFANALSYLAFLAALMVVRLPPETKDDTPRHFLRETVEGYIYAAHHPGISRMLVLMAISSLGTRAFVELLPGFADAVFNRGPQGLAWLTAAVGIGAMAGGVWTAQRAARGGLSSVIVVNMLVISASLIGFTMTDWFGLALACLFIAGFSLVVNGVAAQTLIQTASDRAMRGRVMAIYGMIFRGGPALGALIMGALSSYIGLRLAVAGGAAACALGWIWAKVEQRRMEIALEASPRPIV